MIDFIPLKYYYDFYINLSLIIVLITFFHTLVLNIDDTKNIKYLNAIGYLILFFTVFYIGLRPLSGYYFKDMETYAQFFNSYAHGGPILAKSDLWFHVFTKFCSSVMTMDMYFLLLAIMYIMPMYIISKQLFNKYWFYSFILFFVSFSFWGYGVNGIRNGIATSIFLLAYSNYNNKKLLILFLILSVLFHKSMMLLVFVLILTMINNNYKFYLKLWFLSIPLSLFLGNFWSMLFTKLGFADGRLSAYLSGTKDAAIQSLGFRWDFLIYGSAAVFTGYYFIVKKEFKDPHYIRLFNLYLITNAFWILVIRANFSNRFAYLSWFMMALIIIYPLLRHKLVKNQNLFVGKIMLVYFSFTYFMYYIYS